MKAKRKLWGKKTASKLRPFYFFFFFLLFTMGPPVYRNIITDKHYPIYSPPPPLSLLLANNRNFFSCSTLVQDEDPKGQKIWQSKRIKNPDLLLFTTATAWSQRLLNTEGNNCLRLK